MYKEVNFESKPLVIIPQQEMGEMEKVTELERNNQGRCLLFGLMDYSQPELSKHVWELMNHGMQGVAISCNRLKKLGIKLTSQPMMQMFRMLEDRQAYLLVAFGQDDTYIAEMGQVARECADLKIVLGDLD